MCSTWWQWLQRAYMMSLIWAGRAHVWLQWALWKPPSKPLGVVQIATNTVGNKLVVDSVTALGVGATLLATIAKGGGGKSGDACMPSILVKVGQTKSDPMFCIVIISTSIFLHTKLWWFNIISCCWQTWLRALVRGHPPPHCPLGHLGR